MNQDEIIRSQLGREQLVALAREAGISEDHALGLKPFLERFAALVAEAKDKEIAELYQMCLNQALTIKKYIDKYGELK